MIILKEKYTSKWHKELFDLNSNMIILKELDSDFIIVVYK